jgi:hypothetical protein
MAQMAHEGMRVWRSKVNTDSEDFRANHLAMLELCEQLKERLVQAQNQVRDL